MDTHIVANTFFTDEVNTRISFLTTGTIPVEQLIQINRSTKH